MKIKVVCDKCGKAAPFKENADGTKVYNVSRKCNCGGGWKQIEVYGGCVEIERKERD